MTELSQEELLAQINQVIADFDDLALDAMAWSRAHHDPEASRIAAAYEYCADKLRGVLGQAPHYE